jgi:hypothetical protein
LNFKSENGIFEKSFSKQLIVKKNNLPVLDIGDKLFNADLE